MRDLCAKMKTKIPKLFFENDEKIDFSPEDINWDDETICVLCMRKKCICTIQECPCGMPANICIWPDANCPCQKCDNLIKNCKCLVYIKKED